MKTLVTNYTFSATAKQVTLTDYPSIKLDQILLITNVTDNIIIYNFADPTAGGTLAGNVLTLGYDTTTMSNSDRLQIFIDDYVIPSTEASLTAVNFNLTTFNRQLSSQVLTINQNVSATNTRLQTLITQTDSLENTTSSIADNTNAFNPLNIATYTTTSLTSSLAIGEAFIFSIHGTSYAGYNQYLQVYSPAENSIVFSQIIKANENFYFEFPRGFYLESGTVRNSLTPMTHTPGNNDLIMTISTWI